MKHLYLGGARSGKTRLAEHCAQAISPAYTLIATGWAGDEEMHVRISQHRAARSSDVRVIEEPIALASALASAAVNSKVVVIDCLTLWLSNCLHEDVWLEQRGNFLALLECLQTPVVIVSNEVGSGIVPIGELTRQFADEAGWLNQAVATCCDHVTLVAAGLPLVLKSAEAG